MPPTVARYWIGTIFAADRILQLTEPCIWVRGQQEQCPTTERFHWQIVAAFSRPVRLPQVKRVCGDGHWEPTRCLLANFRSDAAAAYVWKEATRVPNTQFELGNKPFQRNNANDWERVWELAKSGNIEAIPADLRIRYYRTVQTIASDHQEPLAIERAVHVYWGRTGTGKSKRAWEEAGLSAYSKDPRSKWWDGYRSQENIVIDEFRGAIDISHILRWLDRYPVRVEYKGGSRVFSGKQIWITSNVSPDAWYPELDQETKDALLRRLTNVIHFE